MTGESQGMSELASRDVAHLIHPVTSPSEMTEHGPRIVVEGDGWWVTDEHGNRIIDGFAGLWCVTVGHGRREIIDAVKNQMETLEYFTTFHGQSHPRAIELAERIVSMFRPEYGLGHVMFASGGSEANETNFKLLRLYWALRGEDRRKTIVARHNGYHGLTIATMTATGILPMHWNFGPDAPGFEHIAAPYCYKCELGLEYPDCNLACARALEELVEREGPETIAAFVAEPVIGAGGIIPPPADYFPLIREICDRHGILLVVDEVVTGFGRTGTMFGHEQWDVRPDIVTLAKGLTSGYLPLGASVISDEIWDTISENLPEAMPVSHGFTYMGHPVCCAAGLANLDIVESEDLPGNAARVGAYLQEQLRERMGAYESVGDIRGMGLMAGLEFVADRESKRGFSMPHTACVKVEHEAWDRGLYCRAMGIETVGLAPPLTIDTDCVDRMIDILAESVEAMEAELLPAERQRSQHFAGTLTTAADVFAAMQDRFDSATAEGVDVEVAFALTGNGGGHWLLTVRDAKLSVTQLAGETPAPVTIRASAEDYVKIANGELAGAEAFSTKRLTVDGDLMQAATLAELGLL